MNSTELREAVNRLGAAIDIQDIRIARFEGIIKKLRTTADGVPVVLGMLVSWPALATPPILEIGAEAPVTSIHQEGVEVDSGVTIGGEPLRWFVRYAGLYSTAQVALSARSEARLAEEAP